MTYEETREQVLADPALFLKNYFGVDEEAVARRLEGRYLVRGDFTVSCVHSIGGGEGGGEYVERVYAITDSKTSEVLSYIQTVGTYYSYDGIYWENTLTRVYPHKVMVVEFSTTPP